MAYPAGSIVAYIRLNTSEWNKPFGTIKGDLANLSRLSESVGRKMLALSATIIGVGTIAVREFGKFEHAMRISTSVSNATEKEFAQASEKAIEVSKRWNVAATTVANAYLFLGRAGLTMAEQMKSVEPIVLASKAMLTDLEDTTEGIINIIRAFNYTFEDTAEIVGQVTYAANKSTQSLDDILVALSYAGKPAQAANTSFQELAAALSIAANQGIRGSKAGVALRFAFTSLMRPTRETTRVLQRWGIEVYDSERRMKPLPDLLQEIEEGLAGATEEQRNHALATIVGTRATSTWLALLSQGSGEVRKWTENINKAGNEAEDVAKFQLKALAEKWGQIKKGIQAVVYALVDQFTPGLKSASDKLIELTTKTEDWIKANKDNVKEMVKSIAHLGILAAKVGAILLILPKLINLTAAIGSALTSPIVLTVAAIYGLSVVFRDELTAMYNAVKKFWKDTIATTKQGQKDLQIGPGNQPEWRKPLSFMLGLGRDWLAFDPFNTMPDNVFKPKQTTGTWNRGLKMNLPTKRTDEGSWWGTHKEKWIDTIKSDFESMKKLMGNVAESILPAEALAGWNELKKILDDLSTALLNVGEAAEDTKPKVEELLNTLGNDQVQSQFVDWENAVIDWKLAVNDVLDTLPSLREGFEKVLSDINTTFRDSIRGWMDDMTNLSGFLKSIYRGILNTIKDFVAQAIATQLQLKLFGGTTTEASAFKSLMTGRGLIDIASDWLGMRGGGTTGAGAMPVEGAAGYYSGGGFSMNKSVPNISFNITNEIPGAELAVTSAETQADRTVLNATMRLASSNTMFRRTFVNPGGR